MDVEDRTYQYLDGRDANPQLGTVVARIHECGSRGFRVEFSYEDGGQEAFVFPTLAAARATVEQAVTLGERELKRADYEVRQRILAHPWWKTPVHAEDVNRILELASLHPDGVVLVDPWGGFAWVPQRAWHPGCHLRLEIPPGGHCTTSAAFALLVTLDEALAVAGHNQAVTSEFSDR